MTPFQRQSAGVRDSSSVSCCTLKLMLQGATLQVFT